MSRSNLERILKLSLVRLRSIDEKFFNYPNLHNVLICSVITNLAMYAYYALKERNKLLHNTDNDRWKLLLMNICEYGYY
jgi:hypothetical protein